MATNRAHSNHSEVVVTSGLAAAKRRMSRPRRLQHAHLASPDSSDASPDSGDVAFDARAWLAKFKSQSYPGRTQETDAFVRDVLTAFIAVAEIPGVTQARRYARALAHLAAFVRERGTTLSPREALDPRTINQFHSAALAARKRDARHAPAAKRQALQVKAEQTMATWRSCLRRIGEVVNPTAAWEPAPVRHYRHIKPPYTPAEIAGFEAQAARMTPDRARCAEAFLVLGLGAGLDGRWAAKVRVGDVTALPGGGYGIVLPDRLVPVLATYEHRLGALVSGREPEEFLIGGNARNHDAANDAVRRLGFASNGTKFDLARLRSTWLVHHLARGTRLPELMEAAGLTTLTVIGDLAEFVPAMAPDELTSVTLACQAVRGVEPEREAL
jgi:hypothetical protein